MMAFITRKIGEVANIKKVSEIQEMLMNNATLLVAYPDATKDKSDEWLKTVDICRIELRRRHQVQEGMKNS